jgi:phosphatidylserine/phosphatidylglycerophosphate/cardiolipin synthase-like enzyme
MAGASSVSSPHGRLTAPFLPRTLMGAAAARSHAMPFSADAARMQAASMNAASFTAPPARSHYFLLRRPRLVPHLHRSYRGGAAVPHLPPPPAACRMPCAPPVRPTAEWQAHRLPWPSPHAVPSHARAGWFEAAALQARLNTETRSKAHSGNCVRVLVDGPRSFAEKQKAIRHADAIFLKMYQIDDDAAGRLIVGELEEAARRGAKVYLQYSVKSIFPTRELALIKMGLKEPIPRLLLNLKKSPNAVLVPNDAPDSWTKLILDRDHEKYLVTWRQGEAVKLILGGMNISDAWLHGGDPQATTATGIKYRDTDVEIMGPTAADALYAFLADMGRLDPDAMPDILETWGAIHRTNQAVLYPPSRDNAVVRFVRNKPRAGAKGQFIRNLYEQLIGAVPPGERLGLSNAYFLPSKRFANTLVQAADRGVRVEVTINSSSAQEREARVLSRGSHSLFRAMARCSRHPENFSFFEFSGSPQSGHNAMHQKVAFFGDQGPYLIGSSNLDAISFKYNYEGVLLMYDSAGRKTFDSMYHQDTRNGRHTADGAPLTTTRPLSLGYLQHEPMLRRLLQRTTRAFSFML